MVNRGANISVRLTINISETVNISEVIEGKHLVPIRPSFRVTEAVGEGGVLATTGEAKTKLSGEEGEVEATVGSGKTDLTSGEGQKDYL